MDSKKPAEWNPELSSRYRTNRERSEDQKRDGKTTSMISLNKIMTERKTDEPLERKNQNNNTWINIASDRKEWTRLEEKYTMKSVK